MSILQSVRPGVKVARRPKRNPRDSWPAWTDEFTWELGPEPDPVASPDEPEPTPRSLAWNAGWELGYDHNANAVPPAEMSSALALSWWMGRNLGWLRRESDDRTIDRLHASSYEPGNNLTDADIWPLGAWS
jgi:hypothetical protein